MKNRSLRLLWTATTVDAFGSWLLLMAVPLHVFTITGSVTSAGLTLAVEATPAVLIGPGPGAVADRLPRRTVLVVANLAAAAGVGLLLGGLPLLYLGCWPRRWRCASPSRPWPRRCPRPPGTRPNWRRRTR